MTETEKVDAYYADCCRSCAEESNLGYPSGDSCCCQHPDRPAYHPSIEDED